VQIVGANPISNRNEALVAVEGGVVWATEVKSERAGDEDWPPPPEIVWLVIR
jgi:hypothetical protein